MQLDSNTSDLLVKLKEPDIVELLELYDLDVEEIGSAEGILSRETAKNVSVIGTEPCGGIVFLYLQNNNSPVFYLSTEGVFCYLADSLEQFLQILISLPLTAWINVSDPELSLKEMKEEVKEAKDYVKEELDCAEDEEKILIKKASKLISKKLKIKNVRSPLKLIQDNFQKSKDYDLFDLENNRLS
jgi:hypothetical protein